VDLAEGAVYSASVVMGPFQLRGMRDFLLRGMDAARIPREVKNQKEAALDWWVDLSIVCSRIIQ